MHRLALACFAVTTTLSVGGIARAGDRTDYSVERAHQPVEVFIPLLGEKVKMEPIHVIRGALGKGTVELGPRWKDGRQRYRLTRPSGEAVYGIYNPRTWHMTRDRIVEPNGKVTRRVPRARR